MKSHTQTYQKTFMSHGELTKLGQAKKQAFKNVLPDNDPLQYLQSG